MTITAASSYRRPPQAEQPDAAQGRQDRAQIARARQDRDNAAEQQAVAALRRDEPAPRPDRAEAAREASQEAAQRQVQRGNKSVGSALDVKA